MPDTIPVTFHFQPDSALAEISATASKLGMLLRIEGGQYHARTPEDWNALHREALYLTPRRTWPADRAPRTEVR